MEENKKLNYSLQSPKERSKFVQEFINAADKPLSNKYLEIL